jgi:hypothetical protein
LPDSIWLRIFTLSCRSILSNIYTISGKDARIPLRQHTGSPPARPVSVFGYKSCCLYRYFLWKATDCAEISTVEYSIRTLQCLAEQEFPWVQPCWSCSRKNRKAAVPAKRHKAATDRASWYAATEYTPSAAKGCKPVT